MKELKRLGALACIYCALLAGALADIRLPARIITGVALGSLAGLAWAHALGRRRRTPETRASAGVGLTIGGTAGALLASAVVVIEVIARGYDL